MRCCSRPHSCGASCRAPARPLRATRTSSSRTGSSRARSATGTSRLRVTAPRPSPRLPPTRGTNGFRMTNAAGQFNLAIKTLPGPLTDSSVSFYMRPEHHLGAARGPGARRREQLVDDVGPLLRRRPARVLVLPAPGKYRQRDLHRGELRSGERLDQGRGPVHGDRHRRRADPAERADPDRLGRERRLHAERELPEAPALERRDRQRRLRRRRRGDPRKRRRDRARRADRRRRNRRQRLGGALVDGAGLRRRESDHRLPRHAVHRRHRADADPDRLGREHLHGHGSHERHRVHVHRRRDQRHRDRTRLGRLRRDHARRHGDGARCADRRRRHRR